MARQRQSNIELLRILAMASVIMVHLDGASLGLPAPGRFDALTAGGVWRTVVESITIVGVNCFTLISGYFGIRARLSGFLRFTLMCIFYSVAIYSIDALSVKGVWSWHAFIDSWLVYTHTDLWYVPAYMLLYLLSPMLNAAVDSLPRRSFALWLGLFIVANVWCGWYWHANFNPTGYTPIQLIMMYLIGRYVSLDRESQSEKSPAAPLAVYFGATAVTALTATFLLKPTMAYAYNAPFVMVASVALFIAFTRFHFTSATVNSLARGAFAAYLIHKNPIVWTGIVRPMAIDVWGKHSLVLYTAFTLCFTSAVYFLSAMADRLRSLLFGKLEALIDDKVKI